MEIEAEWPWSEGLSPELRLGLLNNIFSHSKVWSFICRDANEQQPPWWVRANMSPAFVTWRHTHHWRNPSCSLTNVQKFKRQIKLVCFHERNLTWQFSRLALLTDVTQLASRREYWWHLPRQLFRWRQRLGEDSVYRAHSLKCVTGIFK